MAERRRKILYVITKSVWGGAQRYVFDLATNLPKDKFDVVVAAGGDGPLFDKLQSAGVRTLAIPELQRDIHIWKESVSLWHLFKTFQKERPDIVHLNSTKVGILGAVAAFFYKFLTPKAYSLKPRVVFTVHGWGSNEDRPRWQKTVIRFLSRFSSLFQDKIILINTADLHAAEQFIPRRKLILIFNGIGEINFLPRKEARSFFSKTTGKPIPEECMLIGTVAEFTKNKGIQYLIEAIHHINLRPATYPLQTAIIGGGEDEIRLRDQINKFGLQDTVFLLGFLPDASRLLNAFDIFVLPSLKEGLPYTIMEAMAAGLPVVATAVGGIPDLIEDQKEGIVVKSKDATALAEAISALANDPSLRIRLGENGRKKIQERFSFLEMIEKTAELYGA